MAYPGDMEEDAFAWRPAALPRVRRPPVRVQQAPVQTSVAATAIALVVASLLAGSFLTLVLLAPKENHAAATISADVVAGVE
jgi:hypothetical protein